MYMEITTVPVRTVFRSVNHYVLILITYYWVKALHRINPLSADINCALCSSRLTYRSNTFIDTFRSIWLGSTITFFINSTNSSVHRVCLCIAEGSISTKVYYYRNTLCKNEWNKITMSWATAMTDAHEIRVGQGREKMPVFCEWMIEVKNMYGISFLALSLSDCLSPWLQHM